MLVQSDDSTRCVVRDELVKLGAKVAVAVSTEHAIKLSDPSKGSDLILFNLEGFESAERIRQEISEVRNHSLSPLIVLCREEIVEAVRSLVFGQNQYVMAQPVDEQKLRDVAELALRVSQEPTISDLHPNSFDVVSPHTPDVEDGMVSRNYGLCDEEERFRCVRPRTPPRLSASNTPLGPRALNHSSTHSAFSTFVTLRSDGATKSFGGRPAVQNHSASSSGVGGHLPLSRTTAQAMFNISGTSGSRKGCNSLLPPTRVKTDGSQLCSPLSFVQATQHPCYPAHSYGPAPLLPQALWKRSHFDAGTQNDRPPISNPEYLKIETDQQARPAYACGTRESLPGSARVACATRRAEALSRFREKRKRFTFEKTVRYASRQRLASNRPRVRGQFVRQATEAHT